jgi:triacylglycerol lipase
MKTDFDKDAFKKSAAREGLSLLTHALLFPFGYLESRHRSRREKDRRTVVFVHGLASNRSVFFPLQTYLRLKGHRHQYSFNMAVGPSIESLAICLQNELAEKIKGGRIDIIAHSLGGLVARSYIQHLDGARRVDRLITLGTPHYGTHAAHFVPSAFVRQLKPGSPFFEDLNQRAFPKQVSCTSFAAGSDALILPKSSALFEHSTQIYCPKLGHNELLLSPSIYKDVHQILNRPEDTAETAEGFPAGDSSHAT